jgi:hypothetical protein
MIIAQKVLLQPLARRKGSGFIGLGPGFLPKIRTENVIFREIREK